MKDNFKMSEKNPRIIAINTYVIIAVVIVIIAASIAATYFYAKYHSSVKSDAQQASQLSAAQKKSAIAKVGKLMYLPEGEDPNILVINDLTAFKDQAFFANAKNGDYVLIYYNAQKGILYDPHQNKIIQIAAVTAINPPADNSVDPGVGF